MKIILLCSGNLGFAVLKQINDGTILSFVFTDTGSVQIISYCIENKLNYYAGNPRSAKAGKIIDALECDLLLSVNYLFIVKENILNLPKKYAINLHGSLLPKYRGRTPHVWAIINGENETGVTAHLMTIHVDDGSIVKQRKVVIGKNDTGFSILQKFNVLYPEIINEIIDDCKNYDIISREQDHTKATYFGKRTPEDGLINWNWQREQIRNWVRAQADPYPGAFTFYENQKVVINEIIFSELGYNYEDQNGLILQTDPELIVKASNGAVKLSSLIMENTIHFITGNILA